MKKITFSTFYVVKVFSLINDLAMKMPQKWVLIAENANYYTVCRCNMKTSHFAQMLILNDTTDYMNTFYASDEVHCFLNKIMFLDTEESSGFVLETQLS